jgi:hypothetical protein
MNTCKHTALWIAIAVPLCLGSALSVADSKAARSEMAMAACVKAFVSTSVPKDRQVAVRTENRAASMVIPRNRPYSIALTATSRTSGEQLAAATCRTNRSGTVIAMNGKSVPTLAAADAKANLTAEDK